jgi:hypothetical protein
MPANGRATIDYKVAKDRFVLEGQSVRKISMDMGLKSWSSMNAIAKRDDWKGQRQAYLASIARRSYETAAATVASEQNAIKDEAILAARATVRAYIQKFLNADGTYKTGVEVNSKDALLWAQFLVSEMVDPGGPSTEAPDHARNVTPPDADLLRRVVEAARERVAPTGGVGPTALVIAPDPRTH